MNGFGVEGVLLVLVNWRILSVRRMDEELV